MSFHFVSSDFTSTLILIVGVNVALCFKRIECVHERTLCLLLNRGIFLFAKYIWKCGKRTASIDNKTVRKWNEIQIANNGRSDELIFNLKQRNNFVVQRQQNKKIHPHSLHNKSNKI